jgi:hypothetical protein
MDEQFALRIGGEGQARKIAPGRAFGHMAGGIEG